jgi:hypothetical protein
MDKGILTNSISESSIISKKDALLSEIRQQRALGNWKHAKDLKRHWIGFEINPEYHKIANDRINGITKKERDSGYQQTKLF